MLAVSPPLAAAHPCPDPPAPAPPVPPSDPESSIALVDRLRHGDAEALERLFARYLVPLKRWAHGRLPAYARSMVDTQDIVQDGIVRVLANLATFRPERTGSFHAYLRTTVMHQIIDQIRSAGRRPPGVELDDAMPGGLPSPYDTAISQEHRELYERALEALAEGERELVIGRVEWGLDYEELAAAVGRPTAEAARVASRRAIVKLAEIMQRLRTVPHG